MQSLCVLMHQVTATVLICAAFATALQDFKALGYYAWHIAKVLFLTLVVVHSVDVWISPVPYRLLYLAIGLFFAEILTASIGKLARAH